MIEMEKRYKLSGEIPTDKIISKKYIEQVYSNINPDVRIRYVKENDIEKYYHTVKYFLKDNQREEIETSITKEQYTRIFESINKKPVKKIRTLINLENNLIAEIDNFIDTGDILIEVEFPNEQIMNNFEKPNWFGNEIKGKQSFSVQVFSEINRLAGEVMENISTNLYELFVKQIEHEAENSYVYKNISSYFKNLGLINLALFFDNQSKDENQHMNLLIDYLIDRDVSVIIPNVNKIDISLDSIFGIMKFSLDKERETTSMIKEMCALASDDADFISFEFLLSFIKEQREEEALFKDMVDIFADFSDDMSLIRLYDSTFKVG